MIVKLLTVHHLEFLSLKEGCRGLPESTLVKMSNCWKSQPKHILSYQGLRFTISVDRHRNCLGHFRGIPWNQTSDVRRGATLITRFSGSLFSCVGNRK